MWFSDAIRENMPTIQTIYGWFLKTLVVCTATELQRGEGAGFTI